MKNIKILIADDHRLVRDGLKSLLEGVPGFEIVQSVNNGREVLEFIRNNPVDIVLMDIDMPVLNGIETTKKLKRSNPEVKVLTLTMHQEKAMINIMLEAGANGYILKSSEAKDLTEAITKIISGQNYFSAGVTMALANKSASGIDLSSYVGKNPHLTSREIEIMKLIAQGFSNSQIGEKLFISHRTVDTHRTNLMKKLEVSNIAGLIRYAISNGYAD